MIKVGIIGANGFLGLELLRILSIHPKVSVQKILKRENDIDDEFTHLSSLNLSELQTPNLGDFHNLDCVFLALPHGSAQEYVNELMGKVKIIDLSSDYRIAMLNLMRNIINPLLMLIYKIILLMDLLSQNLMILKNLKT